MSMLQRAAQFAPFSALSGYGQAIEQTARQNEAAWERSVDDDEAQPSV